MQKRSKYSSQLEIQETQQADNLEPDGTEKGSEIKAAKCSSQLETHEIQQTDNTEPVGTEKAIEIDSGIAAKCPSQPEIQETQQTDNTEPVSLEKAIEIDGGIIAKCLSPQLKMPETQPIDHETADRMSPSNFREPIQSTSNSGEQIQSASNIGEQMKAMRRQAESFEYRSAPHKLRFKLESRSQGGDTTGEYIDWVTWCWSLLRETVHHFVSNYFELWDGSGKQLSESEKRSIIAALDGWCPQEGWDSLLENFSADEYIRSCLPSKLAEALLHKHICDYLFTNPFWSFGCGKYDGMPQTVSDDLQAPLNLWSPVGTQVYNLWQSVLRGTYTPFLHFDRQLKGRMTYLAYCSGPDPGTFMAVRDGPAAGGKQAK
jgi:hypothetical protein